MNVVKETVTTNEVSAQSRDQNASVPEATNSQTVEYVVYFLFGLIEVFLGFRLLLKIAGASTSSAFARMIYGVSGVFISPFEGLFRKMFTSGLETTSVFEPSTLVALLVYVVLAWGVVRLIRIFSKEQQTT